MFKRNIGRYNGNYIVLIQIIAFLFEHSIGFNILSAFLQWNFIYSQKGYNKLVDNLNEDIIRNYDQVKDYLQFLNLKDTNLIVDQKITRNYNEIELLNNNSEILNYRTKLNYKGIVIDNKIPRLTSINESYVNIQDNEIEGVYK